MIGTLYRIVVDLDMKLDLVPPWLINFIARQLVGHGYKLYQKVTPLSVVLIYWSIFLLITKW